MHRVGVFHKKKILRFVDYFLKLNQLERDYKEDLYLYYTYQKLEYSSYYRYALMNYCESTKEENAHQDKPAETS